jgi:hypothetical protein
MRRQVAPAARRRDDRIRAGTIAAVLSAVTALTVEHQTHAQNAPRVNWVFTGGSGKRCGMSPEEFAKFYPPLLDWIRNTLSASAHSAPTVASRGFSRLPLYFTQETLASTKVVLVDPLPIPPLSSMGLARFADFGRGNFAGITYIDTIFLKPTSSKNENIHFHELVHVIQWRLLGPDRFLFSYANGLECFGYRHSPLEAMAYDAQTTFARSTAVFNVEKMVAAKLGL